MPLTMVGNWLVIGGVMIVGLLGVVALLPRPAPEFAISEVPWQADSASTRLRRSASAAKESVIPMPARLGSRSFAGSTARAAAIGGRRYQGPTGPDRRPDAAGPIVFGRLSAVVGFVRLAIAILRRRREFFQWIVAKSAIARPVARAGPITSAGTIAIAGTRRTAARPAPSKPARPADRRHDYAPAPRAGTIVAADPSAGQRSAAAGRSAIAYSTSSIAAQSFDFARVAEVGFLRVGRWRSAGWPLVLSRGAVGGGGRLDRGVSRVLAGAMFSGRRFNEDASDLEALHANPPVMFSEFTNPFAQGTADRYGPAVIVKYTFAALEVWGREHGTAREPDETPGEFARHLGAAIPELAADAQALAALYGRAVYSQSAPATEQVANSGPAVALHAGPSAAAGRSGGAGGRLTAPTLAADSFAQRRLPRRCQDQAKTAAGSRRKCCRYRGGRVFFQFQKPAIEIRQIAEADVQHGSRQCPARSRSTAGRPNRSAARSHRP